MIKPRLGKVRPEHQEFLNTVSGAKPRGRFTLLTYKLADCQSGHRLDSSLASYWAFPNFLGPGVNGGTLYIGQANSFVVNPKLPPSCRLKIRIAVFYLGVKSFLFPYTKPRLMAEVTENVKLFLVPVLKLHRLDRPEKMPMLVKPITKSHTNAHTVTVPSDQGVSMNLDMFLRRLWFLLSGQLQLAEMSPSTCL